MRALVLLLALAVGLATVAAGGGVAQAAGGGASLGATPLTRRAPLRGPQPARVPVARPAAARLPVVFAARAGPARIDSGECRLGCAQSYYFCLAAEAPDTCSGAWTSCLAACSRGATGP
jgi:hypothetical protein